MKCDGMKAVVTGASGPLGAATILALAKEGADVAGLSTKPIEVQDTVAERVRSLGRGFFPLEGHITCKDDVDSMIDQVFRRFEKIDLLVNVAGIDYRSPLEEVTVEDWDEVMSVNVKGVFLCSVACAKYMMRQGHGNIVNVTGASAHRCGPLMGAFGPSKAAVVNLTSQMAVEWARYGIRVNGVSPGPILTPRNKDMIEAERDRLARIPMGRAAELDEITRVIVFLASNDSSCMTGEVVVADCGGVHTWWLCP
jgi:NAD(P)-dependent dehydrogenase (short-subunit alcohol dehydrogenase family)